MMQDLPAGAMLAVRLPEAEVVPMLGEKLSIAALNSPGMTVVSGPFDAIDSLSAALEEKKVMYRRLATSHAFHSAMLDPMLPGFAEVVRSVEMHPPQVPFVSSLTGTWITDEQATSPEYWVQQVRHAVRFSIGIAELLQDPANILLEVGPGQTLSTLARQHPAKQKAQEIVASLKSEENLKPDQASPDLRSKNLGHRTSDRCSKLRATSGPQVAAWIGWAFTAMRHATGFHYPLTHSKDNAIGSIRRQPG